MNELLGKKLGEYFVVEEIGRGSITSVFKAHQPSKDRYVALKVLPPYFARDPAMANRFREEAAAIAKLEHPNIVPLYDYSVEDGLAYLVMELIQGETLKEKVGKPLDLDFAARILSQVAAALDYANDQGSVHQNIKPSNIFLHDETARLSDFAICMDVEGPQSFTKSGVLLPAAEYTSPELAEGYRVDNRSDVYSLGIILYQMVTGELPFIAYTPFNVLIKQINKIPAPPSSIDLTLPDSVDEVIMKAMSKNPRERYGSAQEMASDFQQAIRTGRQELVEYPSVMMARGAHPAGAVAAVVDVPRIKLICPACGTPQPEDARYCPRCWILLAPEEEFEPKPKRFTWRWFTNWLRFHKLLTAAIITIFLYLVWNAPELLTAARTRELPPPASNISAVSGAENWPLARGNNAQTSYVENVPRAPSGKVKWTFPIGSPATSSPVVADGKVFVGSANSKVYAIDAETGQLKWEYQTTGPVDATPAAAGQFVYIGLRDSRFLALDANTGEKKWEFKAGNPIYSPANVAGGVAYLGTADSHLYALDAATGAKRWDYETGGWIDASPALSEGVVAVGSRDGYLHVLDAATGAKRFQYQTISWLDTSPTFAGGLIYVGSDDGKMRAIDPKAKVGPLEPLRYVWVNFYIWGIPVPAPTPPPGYLWGFNAKGGVTSSSAVAHGKVYFGGGDGRVYAVWTLDGSKAWDFKTGARITSSPAIGGETLYVGSEDGKLYALDTGSGAKRWDFQTKDRITASPALAGGVIYINSNDGNLYAIE